MTIMNMDTYTNSKSIQSITDNRIEPRKKKRRKKEEEKKNKNESNQINGNTNKF